LNILYATSEAAPFCRSGGLADVAGSLPPALAKQGDQVAVILPLYQSVADCFSKSAELKMEFVKWTYVRLAWRSVYCGLFRARYRDVDWYFLDNEYYFHRPELYGYYDDAERFGFFSRAVTEMLPDLSVKPDVVHCNEWQTALIPIYIHDEAVRTAFFRDIRTVFTIHNIEYQGRYGRSLLEDLFGLPPGWYDEGTLAYEGDINLLKGAIVNVDAVTTTSRTYAQELKYAYYAHGLERVISACGDKLRGVPNGIDVRSFDPQHDEALARTYGEASLDGKAACKRALQEELGLEQRADAPIVAMISHLVSPKGLDLVCETLEEMLEQDVQFVLLGRGDAQYESFFRDAAQRHPGRMAVRLEHPDHSQPLSRRIYAGADLFLIPSKIEPCGASQMIAMRYGAVPIVRETGGLKDAVCKNGEHEARGVSFANYNAQDMLRGVREAINLYRDDPAAYRTLQKRGMTADDFSWERCAEEYHKIYQQLYAKKS
jgi:starch synthase